MKFNFYDKTTGMLHGKMVATNLEDIESAHRFAQGNAPEGHAFIEGHYDPLSQRVDVETKEVLDYKPPSPSNDHEWNADHKRWFIKKGVQDKLDKREIALSKIALLESQQPRLFREMNLPSIPKATEREVDAVISKRVKASERLQAIEDEIVELRKDL